MTQQAWLITGVSSGFGRHLAEQPLARGDRVVGTVRNPEAAADLVKSHPDQFRAEILDVTGTAALREVADRACADLGRVDVVVSNAGYFDKIVPPGTNLNPADGGWVSPALEPAARR